VAGHVFISYSRTNSAYIDRLLPYLASRGITGWVDRERISSGDQWIRTIRDQIDSCAALIVVMTPAAEESQWVSAEIERARDRGKPIFPLLLDGDRFFELGMLHYDDVRGGHLPSPRFIAALQAIVAPAPPRPAPPMPQAVPVPVPVAVPPVVSRPRGSGRGRALIVSGAAVAVVAVAVTVALMYGLIPTPPGSANGPTTGPTSSGPPASSGPATQGVTGTEILLGTHQPLTGPASSGYSKISAATAAYFAYVNDHGGVNGRKIHLVVDDDMYNPTTTNTVIHGLVEQTKVFAILNGLGTPTHTAVVGYLAQKGIPDLFVGSAATTWNNPGKYPDTFGFQPDYITDGKVLGHFIRSTSGYAGRKVCTFGQNDDYGSGELAGLERGLGSTVASRTTYDVTQQNVAPQVSQLKAAGCQVVVLAAIPPFAALVVGTAAAVGFHPKYVVASIGGDVTVLSAYLKTASNLLEGLVTGDYLPSATDGGDPWVRLFQGINANYNNGAAFDRNVMVGMAVGYMATQALAKAGRNLTAASLIAAVEGGLSQGPGLVPVGYSSTSHAGYTGLRMEKVSNGQAVPLGPAYTTDSASASVRVASGTRPAPPADGIPSP
jgi:ABC-type branched-subunit amino acid transport system substrate-binding protein